MEYPLSHLPDSGYISLLRNNLKIYALFVSVLIAFSFSLIFSYNKAEQTPDGLTSIEWQSIQHAITSMEYQFAWHEADPANLHGYYWAPNHTQGWHTQFTMQGVQLSPKANDDWTWGLSLTKYGYAGAMNTINTQPLLHANKEMLTYEWDANLREWWINDPDGLEQGFTIQQRPLGAKQQSPLILEMAISGNLEPTQNEDSLTFAKRDGTTILTYDKLYVIDDNGQPVPAAMKLINGRNPRLQIVIDDSQATYPLTIDPWVQSAKLTASDSAPDDAFGVSVAMSGDTIVVGAIGDNNPGNNFGSAYVFVRPENGWSNITETAKLTASDAAIDDLFGLSVAISDDTIVVGVREDDEATGAAYVYVRPQSGWETTTETAKLTASDGAIDDLFGNSVAVSGNTIVVGAPKKDNYLGAAYVFERPEGGWVSATEDGKLITADAATGETYGSAVAVDDDTVVVSLIGEDNFTGAAYIFERPVDGWTPVTNETAKLTASDGDEPDHFGFSVAIDDDTIVVGAPRTNAAYVYVRPGGGWASSTETAKLTMTDIIPNGRLGWDVDISGSTIVATTFYVVDNKGNTSGAAYLFVRPGSEWANATETDKFDPPETVINDQFGRSVAISDTTVVVGTPGNETAYIFTAPVLDHKTFLPMVVRN